MEGDSENRWVRVPLERASHMSHEFSPFLSLRLLLKWEYWVTGRDEG